VDAEIVHRRSETGQVGGGVVLRQATVEGDGFLCDGQRLRLPVQRTV